MKFGEILKKVRKQNDDSLYTLGEKLGVSHSYIDKIEKAQSPISEKMYNKLIEVYTNNIDELTLAYLEEKLPNPILEKLVYKNDSLSVASSPMKAYRFKAYELNSSGDGSLLQDFKIKEMIIPMGIQIKSNSYCIEVKGDELQPFFYPGDTVLVEETKETWQELNKKIVMVEKNGVKFIRKVQIINYEPQFFSLNEIYPPFKGDEIKCLGVVTRLLDRDLSNIKF